MMMMMMMIMAIFVEVGIGVRMALVLVLKLLILILMVLMLMMIQGRFRRVDVLRADPSGGLRRQPSRLPPPPVLRLAHRQLGGSGAKRQAMGVRALRGGGGDGNATIKGSHHKHHLERKSTGPIRGIRL